MYRSSLPIRANSKVTSHDSCEPASARMLSVILHLMFMTINMYLLCRKTHTKWVQVFLSEIGH